MPRTEEPTVNDVLTRAWHAVYRRWYDARHAGHRARAAVWGWVADRIAIAL